MSAANGGRDRLHRCPEGHPVTCQGWPPAPEAPVCERDAPLLRRWKQKLTEAKRALVDLGEQMWRTPRETPEWGALARQLEHLEKKRDHFRGEIVHRPTDKCSGGAKPPSP